MLPRAKRKRACCWSFSLLAKERRSRSMTFFFGRCQLIRIIGVDGGKVAVEQGIFLAVEAQ
jgi:hypothetical protein